MHFEYAAMYSSQMATPTLASPSSVTAVDPVSVPVSPASKAGVLSARPPVSAATATFDVAGADADVAPALPGLSATGLGSSEHPHANTKTVKNPRPMEAVPLIRTG